MQQLGAADRARRLHQRRQVDAPQRAHRRRRLGRRPRSSRRSTRRRRAFRYRDRDYVVTDTVGFIRKLPHQLVDAFASTLEETTLADLVLVVADADLEAAEIAARARDRRRRPRHDRLSRSPRIVVFNKIDLRRRPGQARAARGALPGGGVHLGARRGRGSTALQARLARLLRPRAASCAPVLPVRRRRGAEPPARRRQRRARGAHRRGRGRRGAPAGGGGGALRALRRRRGPTGARDSQRAAKRPQKTSQAPLQCRRRPPTTPRSGLSAPRRPAGDDRPCP